MDRVLVELVFVLDVLDLKLGVVYYLLDRLFVVFLPLLNFSLELLSLGYLSLHEDSMLLHYLVNIPVVFINDLINSFFELPRVFFLLSLELLELSSILQHLL